MLSELGKKEVNNPMLIASIPHELRKYDIYSQMQENSLELQTQFDLRATLMDILKVGLCFIKLPKDSAN